jgi:adenylate cyclase
MAAPIDAPLAEGELSLLWNLSRRVDDLLEESLRDRENLKLAFARSMPHWLELTGARGVVVATLNEELQPSTYQAGEFGAQDPRVLLGAMPEGVHRIDLGVFVSQALDVAGTKVGAVGFLFSHAQRSDRLLKNMVETIAEQLDTVLVTIQTASEKHQLVLKLNERLADPVFERGMDAAVAALSERIRVPGLALVFRDAIQPTVVRYRSYQDGWLDHESGARPWPKLEEAIRTEGPALVAADNDALRKLLGDSSTEAVLIPGGVRQEPLGKILVTPGPGGFSAYTLDLIRVLASVLTQRLMDYNRERVHLSQFFAPTVIDELLRDPSYQKNYLRPREEEVGILFADLNSFTRICEQVLEAPLRIGDFVDRWSDGVVRILWKHGGVFDKMVGDCMIGLFGPPFFRSSRLERAEAALRCALEVQAFTMSMSNDPAVQRVEELLGQPGLGVAVGVNLASACCGLFGPNQQYTAFSTGMNQTARLQALGHFREILLMHPVQEALMHTRDPELARLRFGPLTETPVKNVAHPLKHVRVE